MKILLQNTIFRILAIYVIDTTLLVYQSMLFSWASNYITYQK